MTDRISDERLAEYIAWAHQSTAGVVFDVAVHYALIESALRELQERRKDANYDIKVKLGLLDNKP
jgi:hypothetical protein